MIFSRDKGTSQKDDFADFRALIEKFPSWKEKVTSQAELKMVQLEPRASSARAHHYELVLVIK